MNLLDKSAKLVKDQWYAASSLDGGPHTTSKHNMLCGYTVDYPIAEDTGKPFRSRLGIDRLRACVQLNLVVPEHSILSQPVGGFPPLNQFGIYWAVHRSHAPETGPCFVRFYSFPLLNRGRTRCRSGPQPGVSPPRRTEIIQAQLELATLESNKF